MILIDCAYVKYNPYDFGTRYIAYTDGQIFDTFNKIYVKWSCSGSHGYPVVYLFDITGQIQQILLHRVIASTFIGDVENLVVHHKDHNKLNPNASNLEILEFGEHSTKHVKGVNNATSKFKNEKDVHDICQMLVEGITHGQIATIMSDRLAKNITIDVIDKIANGSNWKHISNQYPIKKHQRETMGEFTAKSTLIGKLIAIDGLSIRQCADHLGIEYNTKQYTRFEKCAKRYADKFKERRKTIFKHLDM